MDVLKIPFVRKVGITRTHEGALQLPFDKSVQNHLQTVHASAQFALAENASGEMLQTLFPELVGKVVPVMRDSQIKFRRPANTTLIAHPSVADEEIDKFRAQFERKGRSTIAVGVELKGADGEVVCTALFNWFVQGVPQPK
jgi:acyl-coenzyme A thioesterase PaaI-like protein